MAEKKIEKLKIMQHNMLKIQKSKSRGSLSDSGQKSEGTNEEIR
jgi:hypothetical protein